MDLQNEAAAAAVIYLFYFFVKLGDSLSYELSAVMGWLLAYRVFLTYFIVWPDRKKVTAAFLERGQKTD